jgi:uncharacterized protein (TIGR01777 family)
MKIVLAGGSGQLGRVLERAFVDSGDQVVVVTRSPGGRAGAVAWDGHSVGDWARYVDGSDVVINLAGRSVNCRYTAANLREMFASRIDSTRAVGEAIARAAVPPRVWLQMSTATIYAHRFDAPNDELTGIIGGSEPGAPSSWHHSIDLALAWERTLTEAPTPRTRKIALRSAMVMSPDEGGIFDTLLGLVRRGLGGSVGSGDQFVSWIHHIDFVHALKFLIQREELSGSINLASPNPLPYRDFMRAMREACGVRIGLPATRWMLAVGTWVMRTESELVLKSRRVVPTRLREAGFVFERADWPAAARELVANRLRSPMAARRQRTRS